MENKFNEQFAIFIKNKRQLIQPTTTYDEMVAKIQKNADAKNTKLSMDDFNLMRNYSVRIEQQIPTLFHTGKEAQRVVKQDELFKLLEKAHLKLGHCGVSVMWRGMREYYGISKYFFL